MEFENYETKGINADQVLVGICLNLGGEHDPQKDLYDIRGVKIDYDRNQDQVSVNTSSLSEDQEEVIERLRSHFPYKSVNTLYKLMPDLN